MPRVFVLNGVCLPLGAHRPEIYWTMTLEDIESLLRDALSEVDLEFRQTDSEGEMAGSVREVAASEGLTPNAGAWTDHSCVPHGAPHPRGRLRTEGGGSPLQRLRAGGGLAAYPGLVARRRRGGGRHGRPRLRAAVGYVLRLAG